MTSLDPVFPSFVAHAAELVRNALRIISKRPKEIDTVEDSRNRRAFVQDMLHRNPDAFSSDLDVQNMMQQYPGYY